MDYLWIVLASGLVFVMQGGFAMVESGLTRSKNSINVAVKNLTDLGVSVLIFWLFGFALMFGLSESGIIGTSGFLLDVGFGSAGAWTAVFFLFQSMFCSTSATIVSGAVAERMRYGSYIVSTIILSGLIYPVFGHWAWGGAYLGDPDSVGWLQALGFVDFAGSTVVHSVGGWIAFALLIIIGPRTGRFDKGKAPKKIHGSNIPMVVLGVILLWFGWFGFNGGSTLAFNDDVAPIIVNTTLAAAAGMVATVAVGWVIYKKPEVSLILNGSLAGLVAITANCNVVTPVASLAIGAIGGIVMLLCTELLEKMKIDDAVGAIPVHMAAGAWGTLAVALFGDPERIGTGLDFWSQLGVQALGVVACAVWCVVVAFILLWIINRISPLRVPVEHEHQGLNIAEHGASTEMYDLFAVLETQAKTGDLSLRAPVEPFTEVGQIAHRYNTVLDFLEESTIAKEEFLSILNTVSDALLLIDREGTIAPYYSLASEKLFELRDLAGRSLQSVLYPVVRDGVREELNDFMDLLFNPNVDMRTLLQLNPLQKIEAFFDSQQGAMISKYLDISFVRIESEEGIDRVMVIGRDVTETVNLEMEIAATKKKQENEFELFYLLLNVDPDLLQDFLATSSKDLAAINATLQNAGPLMDRITRIYRHVHTIKGDAQVIGLDFIAQTAHEFEDKIEELKARVPLRQVDFLALAVAFANLQTVLNRVSKLLSRLAAFQSTFGQRNKRAMLSIGGAVDSLVQNLAAKYGKKIKLDMSSFESNIIPEALSKPVKDIVVQCARNALFHGIEEPAVRIQNGKPEQGRLRISATEKNNFLVVSIADDGKGISLEKLKEKIVGAGLKSTKEVETLSTAELVKFLFHPNISTAESSDMTAGRGMGMNIVQSIVKKLGGKIELKTKQNSFTEFLLSIPLRPRSSSAA